MPFLPDTLYRNPTMSNKLDIELPSDTEIVFTRRFEAPREIVWEYFTEPDKLRQWLGGGAATVCEIDLRVGGAWRIVLELPHGTVPLRGKFTEMVPPERFVRTVCYDVPPQDAYVWTESAEFEEDGRATRFRSHVWHGSKEARDIHLTGAGAGAKSSYDALDRILAAIQAHP
jgi:uncharacterized protein YndB with AHSA1/START domain